MPNLLTILFRALIVLALSAHVFMMYGMARTMRETFGFDFATAAIASAFAFFLMLPFVWAVMLADVPAMLALHRARRRFRRGNCPACGYQLAASGATTCSECGSAMARPPTYEVSRSTLGRFLLLNLVALVVGIGVCEMWLVLDEHRFRDEVVSAVHGTAAPVTIIARPRIAPFDNASVLYNSERGFSAND